MGRAEALARALGARPIPSYPVWLARLLARTGDLINLAGVRSFPFNSFRLRNILTEASFDLAATETVIGPLPYSADEGVKRTAEWFKAFEAGDPGALRMGGVYATESGR